MPVHRSGSKNGKACYQWGRQKRYCGKGAKKKAAKQGRAAYANGYRPRTIIS